MSEKLAQKGRLISIEGGDGAGKSSLIIGLHAALIDRGLEVMQTRAPGGTQTGAVIRDLLLHPKEPVAPKAELFLYLADRAEHTSRVIVPALDAGKIILCDRFNDSTIAYQGGGRGFGLSKIEELCLFATGGVTPDLTLYLDIDPEIGLARVKQATGKKDQIEAEAIAFHHTIRETFHKIRKQEPYRVHILDALEPREIVFEKAMKLIDDHCFAPNS